MKSRVFVIHGWGGTPRGEWFPWVKKEISKLGYEVIVPEMPDTNHPKIGSWVNKLNEVVGETRLTDIFIGHSIGCQTILRFVNSFEENQIIDKIILVAPWWYLTLEGEEEKIVTEPWLKIDVDFEKIKSKENKIVSIFSDDDPFVPLDINQKFFKEKLNSEIIIENKKGHFSEDGGIFEIPVILDLLK